MAYARWVKQGKKVYGPYFYDTVEAEDGTKKTVYLGTEPPRREPDPDPNAVTPERDNSMPEIGATALVIIFILLFGYLSFTGYLAGMETHNTMSPDKVFAEPGSHTFEMEVPGNLTSLSLSGTIVGNGSVRVYLLKSDEMLLVLDSDSLAGPDSPDAGLSITGHLVDETPSNETPTDDSTNETEGSENKSIETETSEPEDTTPPNETSDEQPALNETLPSPQTLQENLTAEQEPPTQPANETNLTRSMNETGLNETLNQTPPSESNLTQNITAPENITNVTTPDNQTTPVYNETNMSQINETALQPNITNVTIPEPQVNFTKRTLRFKDTCIDTCSLEPEYHDEITLLVELDPKTKLRIKTITYSVRDDRSNLPPEGQVPNQTMGINSTLTINLDEFFTDPEGEPLRYTPKSKELHVESNGSILQIASGNETGDFRVWVTARDAGRKKLKHMFYVNVTNYTQTEPVTVTLEKQGEVDKILRCAEFDEAGRACSAWEFTDIDFEDDGEEITFVPEDPLSIYMGSDIPAVSYDDNLTGNWTIRFDDSWPYPQVVYTFATDDYNAETQPDDSTIYFRQRAEEPAREIPVDDGSVVPRTIARMYLDKYPIRFESTSARLVYPAGEEALAIDAVDGRMVLAVEPPSGGFIPGATIDLAVSPAPQIVEEISAKRSLSAKHFRTTDDNVFKAVFFAVPVHYMNNSGNIKDFNSMWEFRNGRFYSMPDFYQAEANNISVFVEGLVGNDTGNTGYWSPQVFIDGEEITPLSENATLLTEDPRGDIFENNTLEWDYGLFKRMLRLEQGSIQEIYLFESDPGGNLTIRSNWQGNLTPSEYYAIDAEGDDLYGFEVVGDEKRVPAITFSRVPYPVEIDPTLDPPASASTDDGHVTASGPVYADVHGQSSGNSTDSSGSIVSAANAYDGHPTYEYMIARGFLDFDTSGIGAGRSVTEAILSLYGFSKGEADSGQATLHAVEGVHTPPPAASEYGAHVSKTTSGGSIAYSSFSTGSYNNITLNAAGRGWIDTSDETLFCLRVEGDRVGSSSGIPTDSNFISIVSASGGSPAKLYVTYTLGIGESCSAGTDCGSGLCVNGYCRASCNGYDKLQCSTDSAVYNSGTAGVCTDGDDTCDYDEVADNTVGGTGNLYSDCSDVSTLDRCDSDGSTFAFEGACNAADGCTTSGTLTSTGATSCLSAGNACDYDVATQYTADGICASSACTQNGNLIAKSGATYYSSCTNGYECDSFLSGASYLRDGYCCSGCQADYSVAHGGACCGIDVLCNDATPSSCRSADNTCGYDDGQSCTTGDDCDSDLCVNGYCRSSCASYPGYGCSDDATIWSSSSAGTCTTTGCDDSGETRMDCGGTGTSACQVGTDTCYASCTSTSGDSCDSDAGGNFAQDGTCTSSGCTTSGAISYLSGTYYAGCTDTRACDSSPTGGDYSRSGYCCSGCQADYSVGNGGACCGIDALCNDAIPSSCRAADSKCGYDNGQSCTTGDQCDSDLCVNGVCRASCDTHSGYGCSTNTALYYNSNAGTCYDSTPSSAGGTYGCDYTAEFRMDCGGTGTSACQIDTDASYATCDASSGDSCDSDAGGNFGQNGICASGATYNCNTAGFVCKTSGGTHYADESAVGNCAADDECDNTLTSGDFSAGTYRYNYLTASNTMDNGYSTDTSDDQCCSATGSCVDSGTCYADSDTSTDVDSDGDNDYCSSGTWYDCSTSDQCGAGETCNASNDCAIITEFTCGTCDECTDYINNGSLSSGGTLTLTADITGYAGADDSSEIGESCIKFDGRDNIIFDCDGFTISGDGDNYGYGVWFNETNDGSDNNTIKDCTNISYFSRAVRIDGTSGNTEYNTIQNMTAIRNWYGIQPINSRYGTYTNVSFEDTTYFDVIISLTVSDCWQTFDNVTGSGGRPIEYYNTTSVIEDKILSSLILCDADDSTVDNVTIIGSDGIQNNGIQLGRTTGAKLTNINVSNCYGIYLNTVSDNNIFENLTLNNDRMGVYLVGADGNIFTNITSIGSSFGIRIYSHSNNNIINDSRITDSTNSALYFQEYSSNTPYDNLIYNNYFDNSGTNGNTLFDAAVDTANYFNVTKDCSKTNILGGPCIGGNYWANDTDTEFSQTCSDTNRDGICDSAYTLYTNNHDNLSLTKSWETCDGCDDCSAAIATAPSGSTVRLTADIIGYAGADDSSVIGESCIKFDGRDGITFDCDGFTISGDGDIYGWGIWLNQTNDGSDNNIIKDCTNISYFGRGIRIDGSGSNSQNNTIQNTTVIRNQYGIQLYSSMYGTLTNVTSEESTVFDFYISGAASDCWQTFDNVTGSGGRPIGYYNETSNIEDQTFSELILCDADDSTVDNVTIISSESRRNNVFLMVRTTGAKLTNINASYVYDGIYINAASDNNIFENITANYNTRTGIYIISSNSNNLTNITGIGNAYGIALYSNAHDNIINDSNFTGNTNAGIWFNDYLDIYRPYDNIIYNNYFDNSGTNGNTRFDTYSNMTNYWNVTRDCSGETNILGGPCIGGNYWANDTGTEHSQTCTDTNKDGICDSVYTLYMNNTDNLSLTYGWKYTCNSCDTCTAAVVSASPGETVTLTADITGYAGADDSSEIGESCVKFDGADNIIFDCDGFTISGDGDSYGHGIWLNETNGGSDNNIIKDCTNISYFERGIRIDGSGSNSQNNTIQNSTLTRNNYGLVSYISRYGTFTNVTLEENIIFDAWVVGDCMQTFDNVTSSGGREIGFYNETSLIEDQTFSELILCDADDSTVDNVTIMGSENRGNNLLLLVSTSGATLTNINSSYNYNGIRFSWNSDNNIFENITVNYNVMGVYIVSSDGNNFTNITATGNTYAIGLYGTSHDNAINDSIFTDSTNAGIFLDENGGDRPYDNLIYNNYFNNSGTYGNLRFDATADLANYWNTTRDCSQTNILGGPCIAGNYWANDTGTEFSQTCSDADGDGICDSVYTLYTNNYDNLSLTYGWNITCNSCDECTNYINNGTLDAGDTLRLAANIIGYAGADDSSEIGESCIKFDGADNVIFDCDGFTISGDGDNYGYGIWLNETNDGSDNNIIKDCTNISYFSRGIRIDGSSGNTQYNTIQNVTAIRNRYGVFLVGSSYGTLTNISFEDNIYFDAHVTGDCRQTFDNVTGSGGRPIGYYNTTSVIEDQIFSELILCDADDSTVDNVTIISSENIKNNVIQLMSTSGAKLTNINSSYNYDGIRMASASDNNILENITANYNTRSGIYIYTTNGNNLTNITAIGNAYGINFYMNSNTNIINDSTFTDNTNAGVFLDENGGDKPYDNLIYNNYFNNSGTYGNLRFDASADLANYWNTTRDCSQTNIIGGPCIGGNYWTNGTDFSDTCSDTNKDGICDSVFTFFTNNNDSLSLTYGWDTCDTCDSCTAAVATASSGSGGTVTLTADITGYAGADDSSEIGESCVKFDGADNVIFDCDGFTISGDGDNYGYGIWLNETNDGSDNNIITNCTNVSYFSYGISIDGSSGNSQYNTIQNVTSTRNGYGVVLSYSRYGTITNVSFEDNAYCDAWVGGDCMQTFDNVTGSGGREIGFYNETSLIEDQTFSELIICDADDSTVDNVTIIGSDSIKNNGILMFSTTGAKLTNINSSYNRDGIYMGWDSDNNIFENTTMSHNTRYGVFMAAVDGNNFTNITATGNTYGIGFYSTSNSNMINDSRVTDSTSVGIYFNDYIDIYRPYNNLIYNNYFNNSGTYGNLRFDTYANMTNYWNVTKDCSKTNILGGPCIAGNYWANDTGTEFSQTCSDTNKDGICDSVYTLYMNNTDNLSLTYGWDTCDTCDTCTAAVATASSGSGGTVTLTADITGYAGADDSSEIGESCVKFDGKDNVIFDCDGFTISGDGDNYGYGIWLNETNDGSDNNTIKDCTNVSYFGRGIEIDGTSGSTENNTIQNTTLIRNYYGVYLAYSSYGTLINVSFDDTIVFDFYSGGDCRQTFDNVTGSGGWPIEYYNTSSVIEDKILSELALCDADGSTIDNVTIMGSEDVGNNLILMMGTSGVKVTNTNSSYNYYGIYMGWDSDNNIFENVTLNNNVMGVGMYSADDNNFTNITAIGNYYGIDLYLYSQGNIINDSTFTDSSNAGIWIRATETDKPYDNLIYNNYFNNSGTYGNLRFDTYANMTNYWNVTKDCSGGPNIIGGPCIAGNYWANDTGTEHSQTCSDTNKDGICDSVYTLYMNNTDNLSLTYTSPTILLTSPSPGASTEDQTPDFTFNVSSWVSSTYNCTVYVDNGTTFSGGMNDTTLNDTSTTITSMLLAEDTYTWWVNCTDNTHGIQNQSETRSLTVDVNEYTCNSCSDCTAAVASASSGETVRITTNLDSAGSGCINLNGNDGITLDCDGRTVYNSNPGSGDYGIYSDVASGANNTMIKDCSNISYFQYGIYVRYTDNITIYNTSLFRNTASTAYALYLHNSENSNLTLINASENDYGLYLNSSNNNTLTNITTNSNTQYGLYLDSSNNNTLTNITTNSNTQYGLYLDSSNNSVVRNATITITGNQVGLYAAGSPSYCNDIDTSNTVNSKPVQYFDGYYKTCPNDQILDYNDTYSQVAFVGCDNVTLNATETIDSVYLWYTNNTDIYNVNSSYNYDGIYLDSSDNNTFTNITANSNTNCGLDTFYSNNNTFTNITINSNDWGISCVSSNSNTFTDITANSNDWTGLTLSSSHNNILTDITANSNTWGLYLYSSNNNTLTNITASYGSSSLYLDSSNNNTLTNITAKYNDDLLISSSNNNTLTNITAKYNDYGIKISSDSDYNNISNSYIQNNTLAGIYLDESSSNDPEYNIFYNNYFNNSGTYGNLRIESGISGPNYFNVTRDCSGGTNILGGPCIGGNYWANDTGTEHSQLCLDTNGDGICDIDYNLTNQDSVAYDWLPLTYTPPTILLESPVDDAIETTDRTPGFTFNVSSWVSGSYNCTLYLDNGTTFSGGMNDATLNDTSTTIASTVILVDDDYDWWVNCTNSGGRENQSAVRNISINVPVTMESVEVLPSVAWTNTTLYCRFNITHSDPNANITANITWWRWNQSGPLVNLSLVDHWVNVTQGVYNYSAVNLTWNFTNHNESWFCSVRPCDDTKCYEWYNSSNLTIQEYETNLSIDSVTSSPIQSQQVYIYANYTSDYPRFGLGLNRTEIGQVMWNKSFGIIISSIAFFDCENKGRRDCTAVGASGSLKALYANGTQITSGRWPGDEAAGIIYEIEVGDLDGDSYYNDIVTVESGDSVRVFNETGDEVWSQGLGTDLVSVAIGDLDNDGSDDDFAVGDDNGRVYAFNTSDGTVWEQMWNVSIAVGSIDNVYEILITDLDNDGDDDVAATDQGNPGSVAAFVGYNGTFIWNASGTGMNWPVTMAVGDIDHDGWEDDVVVGTIGDIYVFTFNGTYNAEYDISDAISTTDVPVDVPIELEVLDIDDDGWEDDYVVAERGDTGAAFTYVWAFDNSSNHLWNYTVPGDGAGQNQILSMSVRDINDDSRKEIIFADEDYNILYVLNKSGSLLWKYTLGLGDIGSASGKSPGIDISDINNDGINDITVASLEGYVHILQSVNCTARFNDTGSVYSANWNDTARLWQVNRTFSSGGDYSYNITCTKGGYEQGFVSGELTIESDDVPMLVSLESPANNVTNTTYRAPDFTFNVTDSPYDTFNCSLYTNQTDTGTGTPVLRAYNSTTWNDTSTVLTPSTGLSDGYHDWWVNCTDGYTTNQSDVWNISVQVSELTCNSCDDCTTKIASSISGDTVRVTADLTTTSHCIDLAGKDNITLDCDGHTIEGSGSSGYYGINSTVADGANNTMIKDCSNISYFERGIYINDTSNITIYNTSLFENTAGTGYGLYFQALENSNLTLINSSNNDYGFFFITSNNNTLRNAAITTTGTQGGLSAVGSPSYRNDIDTSNTVDGKPVQYFDGYYKACPNNQILDYNDTYSQVAFVDCDNITLKNSTLTDSVHLFYTNNSNIYDINSSYGFYGIYLSYYNTNNTLTNITTNSNLYGLYLYSSDNNTLTNITTNSNDYGLMIYGDSDYNNITSSQVLDNTNAGLYLDVYNSDDPEFNIIYNNYFNNSGTYGNLRIGAGITNDNYFNVTPYSGTSILGGPYIAGNYWANDTGTEHSQLCPDTDGDGLCDTDYLVDSGYTWYDYEPLTYTIPTIQLTSPSSGASTDDTTPDFTFNVTGWVADDYNCTTYVDNGTTYQAGMNDTTLNDTSTAITSTLTLLDGTYTWWVNCTDNTMSLENQSDVWSLTISTMKLNITRTFQPHPIFAGENETVTVNTTLQVNQTSNDVVQVNITDQIPWDFTAPQANEVTVYFVDDSAGTSTDITTNSTVSISVLDQSGALPTLLMVNITNISETDADGYLEENDSILLLYEMITSQMSAEAYRLVYTNATVTDNTSQEKSDWLLSNITASEVLLRGWKYIWHPDLSNPQDMSVIIEFSSMGGPTSGIYIADYLPQGAEVNDLNVSIYNSSLGSWVDLVNGSDYYISLDNPGQSTLPDGVHVDIHHYNLSYACTNWDCNLYDNDTIRITYNITVLGGGEWILPAIIAGFDPEYQKHIKTEMYASANVPSFDVLLEILTDSVDRGGVVKALLRILNVGGPKAKVDVFVTYAAKTLQGEMLSERSETLAVVEQKERSLELTLPEDIEPGTYIFESFVSYTGREAMSTGTFIVRGDSDGQGIMEYSLYIFLAVIVLVLIMMYLRVTRKKGISRPSTLVVMLILAMLLAPLVSGQSITGSLEVIDKELDPGDELKTLFKLRNSRFDGYRTEVLITYSLYDPSGTLMKSEAGTYPVSDSRDILFKTIIPKDSAPGEYSLSAEIDYDDGRNTYIDGFMVAGEESSIMLYLITLPLIVAVFGVIFTARRKG